jgi:hypothetical protein
MNFTDAQIRTLEKELEKLKKKKREEDFPVPLKNPDFNRLKKLLADVLKNIDEDEEDDDTPHYVYESALEAVYGNTIWTWINRKRS